MSKSRKKSKRERANADREGTPASQSVGEDAGGESVPADERRLPAGFGAIMAAHAVSLLAAVVSAYLPHLRLWGINHLAFYPVGVREFLMLMLALSFVPAVALWIYRGGMWIPAFLNKAPRRNTTMTIALIAVLCTLLFFAFRTSTNLLGDGQLIEQSFDAAEEGNRRVVMRNVTAIVTEERIAPGATLLYYAAAKVATRWFDKPPGIGIRWFNCILGGLIVFFFLRLIRDGPFGRDAKLWLLFLGLFSASMQLFFGYIENYPPLVFFTFLYVVTGFLVLHERRGVWLPVLIFAVGFYTHIQAFVLGPSLVYLVLYRFAKRRRRKVERLAVPLLLALALAGVVVGYFMPDVRAFYLPFVGNDDGYGLVSPAHIADMLNEIALLLPILPGVLVMWFLGRRMEHGGPSKRRDLSTWFAHTSEWQFLTLMLAGCAIYFVLFKPEIGMARDWDLFTMASCALVPMVVLVVSRYFRESGAGSTAVARLTAPALALSVLTGLSWFGVNASADRSTERFERLLAYDQTHASYAYENLAIFHHDRGDLAKSIEIMEICTELSQNPRQFVRLAMYYMEAGRSDDAINLMEDVLERRPDYEKARYKLIEFLDATRQEDRIFEVAREGVKQNPTEPAFHFYYGAMLIRRGEVDAGLEEFRICLKLNPPDLARKHIMDTFQKLGKQP